MPMCKCHPSKTFCPDMICVDFVDDVPVFARRDSQEGREAEERMREAERERDLAEYERIQQKYGLGTR